MTASKQSNWRQMILLKFNTLFLSLPFGFKSLLFPGDLFRSVKNDKFPSCIASIPLQNLAIASFKCFSVQQLLHGMQIELPISAEEDSGSVVYVFRKHAVALAFSPNGIMEDLKLESIVRAASKRVQNSVASVSANKNYWGLKISLDHREKVFKTSDVSSLERRKRVQEQSLLEWELGFAFLTSQEISGNCNLKSRITGIGPKREKIVIEDLT
ncbi:hypothetical protein Tco_0939398 [Tanacetum coccineum]|uniref:Uncharacterized protein n=1 Tax=Tanacetum coccineum TaxID=301880 RepID=A0ABQ5DKV7_9ASTR